MRDLHTVTVTVDDEGLRDEVKFTCAGTRESECHIYPDAEEWHDDDGQERIAHDKCWLWDWFDNDCYSYYGADSLDDGGEMGVPHVARSGEIEVEYFYGEGPRWRFKEATNV